MPGTDASIINAACPHIWWTYINGILLPHGGRAFYVLFAGKRTRLGGIGGAQDVMRHGRGVREFVSALELNHAVKAERNVCDLGIDVVVLLVAPVNLLEISLELCDWVLSFDLRGT